MEETIIKINDNYGNECLKDSAVQESSDARKPKGFVEIYEVDEDGTEKLVGKNNLVVYQAREWIAERIFNENNASTSTTPSMWINWLGLGSGGAPTGDPLTPNTPISTETDLDTKVPINPTDSNCADWDGSDYYKHPLDVIEFQQDVANDNKYLITKVTTTIGTDDANGASSQNLNEAGLFVSTSDTGGHSGPFYLFSRVTFPTIVKDITRQLMFIWYIYF
jgi:hypothetical protein